MNRRFSMAIDQSTEKNAHGLKNERKQDRVVPMGQWDLLK
jgi:hypothetical protein